MSNSSEGGIGVVGLAWIALIILKALGILTWGWVSVLLFPIWFPIALVIGTVALVILLVMALAAFSVVIITMLVICGVLNAEDIFDK